MRDIPIMFSAPMILGLDREATERGTGKSMTRRLATSPLAKVQVGDRLWVREALKADKMENFLTGERTTEAIMAYYAADDAECLEEVGFNLAWGWKRPTLPSMHMPRTFSRYTLIVTGKKVERLWDITEQDCEREGVRYDHTFGGCGAWLVPGCALPSGAPIANPDARIAFACLWDSLHGRGAWNENPEVVALTFTVHKKNIDALKVAA